MATSPSGRPTSDSQLDAQIEATLQAARDLGCEAAVKKDIELFDMLAEVDENDLVNRLTTQYKLTHEKVGLIIKGISDEDFFFLAPHLGITEPVIARARLVWKGVAPPITPASESKAQAAGTATAGSDAGSAAAGSAPPPPPPASDDEAAPGHVRKNSSSTNSNHESDVPAGGAVFSMADDADSRKDSKSTAKADPSSLISPKSVASGGASASASFVVAPPDSKKGDEKSHSYAEITHSFTIVSRQIENGLSSCKRVIAFIKKFTAQQTLYAKELIAITAHESNKIHKLQDDGMRRYNDAFGGFQEAMLDVAKIQQDYSNKILAEVVTPLTDYHAKAETRRKAIMEEEKKFTTAMKACTDSLNKQKLKCLQMLDALKTRKEKKTKEEDDKKKLAASGGGGGGFLSSLKSRVSNMTESTMEEQTDKCYKELQAYQLAIKSSNDKAKQYYTVDLPRIFDALQQLETQRLNTLRDYMKKYVDIQSGSMEPFKSMCVNLGRKVGSMDARGDMNEWVASIIKQHGPTPELRKFTYDLPISPEDVKANRLEASEIANTLFRSTLPRVMELQKAKYPSLDLPKVIITLCGWIREFESGVKTKGLFRISASKEELNTVKKQLEKGDYDTKTNKSIHVASGLLKEFLRELTEPLFPQDLYAECINAVKDVETVPPAEMTKKVLALFDRLPPLTQRVIKYVGVLLREVSSPENAALNMMTIDNLAIVFAPSLLRCPHDDPMEMLSNSKFETRFTAVLFGSLH